MQQRHAARGSRRTAIFIFVLLIVEFLDEFIFGVREAAWPMIRDDLGLSYGQVGLLLSLPNFIGSFIEPGLGILGDVWKRKALIIGGGIVFAGAILLTSVAGSFTVIMLAFILFSPASGAFVSLSQATLMDTDPNRHEQNMARWTFAGSAGVVSGALALAGFAALGLGWRVLFLGTGFVSLAVVAVATRFPYAKGHQNLPADEESPSTFKEGMRNAAHALRRREVVRWLTLLEFSDLMLDVLYGYLALYFVDVVGIEDTQASLAVAVWLVVGLLGDFLLIPLLEQVRGLTYLRISAMIELVLFPAFLLIPGILPKLVILGIMGLFNAGWYSILKGRLYSSMPGQSGTVLAVNNISGLVGSLIPLGIGMIAERFGLDMAMWAMLLGPIALLMGIPTPKSTRDDRG
jgi:MFS transporter, FSR family, fosmidomycin resistance protein